MLELDQTSCVVVFLARSTHDYNVASSHLLLTGQLHSEHSPPDYIYIKMLLFQFSNNNNRGRTNLLAQKVYIQSILVIPSNFNKLAPSQCANL